MKEKTIVGIGSALVDMLLKESDEFLKQIRGAKGGMSLVDKKFIQECISNTDVNPIIVPGGSACNTTIGIGRLGGSARFVGKLGNDETGNFFEASLKKNNVDPYLIKSDTPTGSVLSVITPDAERTMFTFLGASSETMPSEITYECFKQAAVVHIEGYLLFNPELMMQIVRKTKESGALISLDLASYTVVDESKELLNMIVENFVDIIIANEDEAKSYTGFLDETKALTVLASQADIAVLKIGKRGSYIAYNNGTIKIDAIDSKEAVDTTGAGDLWASGFLFGLVNDYDLKKCGQLGSLCGYEVCQNIGAQISGEGWEKIEKFIH